MGDASPVLPLLLLLEWSSRREAAGEGDWQPGWERGTSRAREKPAPRMRGLTWSLLLGLPVKASPTVTAAGNLSSF